MLMKQMKHEEKKETSRFGGKGAEVKKVRNSLKTESSFSQADQSQARPEEENSAYSQNLQSMGLLDRMQKDSPDSYENSSFTSESNADTKMEFVKTETGLTESLRADSVTPSQNFQAKPDLRALKKVTSAIQEEASN